MSKKRASRKRIFESEAELSAFDMRFHRICAPNVREELPLGSPGTFSARLVFINPIQGPRAFALARGYLPCAPPARSIDVGCGFSSSGDASIAALDLDRAKRYFLFPVPLVCSHFSHHSLTPPNASR